MTANWKTISLGEVASVGAGNAAPQAQDLFKDGIHPFFRTADAGRIRFGDICESTDYLTEAGIKGLRRFPKGTILFPKSGASTFLNHRVMLGVDGYVSSHLATIVADQKKSNPRFLLYFLSTVEAQNLVQDHSYPSLNLPIISAIKIPLPSLTEQDRIVRLLDEAFNGIISAKANAEKNLQNARALFEGHLQSAFTDGDEEWGWRPLGDLAEFKNGLNFDKSSSGQTLPYVGVADFKDNTFAPMDQLASVTIDGTLARGYELKNNDIVVVRSNGSKHLVGRSMLIGDVNETTSYSGFVIRIRLKNSMVFPQFLLKFLKCQNTRQILTSGGSGANITNINQGKLTSLRVPLPPYDKQIDIAAALDEIQIETQSLEGVYRQKITALDELKKSLLHQAFTGQLTAA